jgi:hypothetical protein
LLILDTGATWDTRPGWGVATFIIPAGGTLAGSDVLPGFSLALAELFYQ